MAAAYAEDDTHPAKDACEAAASAAGWTPPPWYPTLRAEAVPRLATVDRATTAASDAGLARATAEAVRVPLPELGPEDLVAWRLGMAQIAPFLATLAEPERDAVRADAVRRLGDDPPVLVRSFIVICWRAPT